MLAVVIEFSCDGCSAKEVLRCESVTEMPHMQTLISAYGWGQFLGGHLLCAQCCQSAPVMERVGRIFNSSMTIRAQAHAHVSNERHSEDMRTLARVKTARQYAKHPPGKPGPKPRVSDETIVATIQRCEGNKSKAARELGIGYNTIWDRIRRMAPAANGVPSAALPESLGANPVART